MWHLSNHVQLKNSYAGMNTLFEKLDYSVVVINFSMEKSLAYSDSYLVFIQASAILCLDFFMQDNPVEIFLMKGGIQ